MKKITLLTALLLVAVAANAQPGFPSLPVPVDGGLGLLIAGGAILGGKKLLKRNEDTKA